MSSLQYPMDKAVSRGMMELWHPESAIIEIVFDLRSEEGTLFPNSACSSGNGVSWANTVGCGFDGRFIQVP